MNSEQEVLKILENKGKAHIQFIAKQMGISNNYARLICVGLARKRLIKQLQNKDWYEIKIKIKKIKKNVSKKAKKAKDNPGAVPAGRQEEKLNLEQIIDKGIGKGIKKVISFLAKWLNKENTSIV